MLKILQGSKTEAASKMAISSLTFGNSSKVAVLILLFGCVYTSCGKIPVDHSCGALDARLGSACLDLLRRRIFALVPFSRNSYMFDTFFIRLIDDGFFV